MQSIGEQGEEKKSKVLTVPSLGTQVTAATTVATAVEGQAAATMGQAYTGCSSLMVQAPGSYTQCLVYTPLLS